MKVSSVAKWSGLSLVISVLVVVAVLYAIAKGAFGTHEGPGKISMTPIPAAHIAARKARQSPFAPPGHDTDQILFGDLHAHTTLSADAFIMSLPILGGDGSKPQANACDYARYCSALDFWSINDHAEQLTPRRWSETKDVMRQCNAVYDGEPQPDTVAFLGWEWTQMGTTPEDHYGHRNVILKSLDEADIPTRPIAASSPGQAQDDAHAGLNVVQRALLALATLNERALDAGKYYTETDNAHRNICPIGVPVRDLPSDCMEFAETPADLFDKLEEWGMEAIVIPHGTTWGNYTPPGSTWKKQLGPDHHHSKFQTHVELYSGHGNSEEYREWRSVAFDKRGQASCPEPTDNYISTCWRAGEIIRERCLGAGEETSECASRAKDARKYAARAGVAAHLVVPGYTLDDWLDAGQCQDCFLPAFNYRPRGSAQFMLSQTNFDDPDNLQRFEFGFIGSSDNHKSRVGNGYKEIDRRENTETTGDVSFLRLKQDPAPFADPVDIQLLDATGRAEISRINSFFSTGGLVGLHASGRDRGAIWASLQQKNSYATSGERMLLWFDLMNGPAGRQHAMGSSVRLAHIPEFRVKAVGALEQKPGCPDYSREALGEDRLNALCRAECHNPGTTRKRIDRIEVIKITPQAFEGEAVGPLIQDPWLSHTCLDEGQGCTFTFSDPDYSRDSVYYTRALQEESLAVNGDNLRCTLDESGSCIDVNPCSGDPSLTDVQDDCLAPVQERAWSSPIFVNKVRIE